MNSNVLSENLDLEKLRFAKKNVGKGHLELEFELYDFCLQKWLLKKGSMAVLCLLLVALVFQVNTLVHFIFIFIMMQLF